MYDTNGSIASRNKKRLKGSPCLTPLAKLRGEVIKPFTMIDEKAFVLRSTIILIKEGGNFTAFKILYSHW